MEVDVHTLTASSPTKPFKIKVHIKEELNSKKSFSTTIPAFIDSGAMGNFIHPRLVKRLGIPTHLRPHALELQTVTGNRFFSVKKQVTLNMTTRHGHQENLVLNVAPVG